MTCVECEPLIGPYADGELEPARGNDVSAHLAICSACAASLAAIRDLGDAVRQLSTTSPPADLWDSITKQLSPPAIAGRIQPRRRVPWLRIASVAALVLVAGYTGWLAYRPAWQRIDPHAPAFVDLAPILDKGIPVKFDGADEFKFVAAPLDKAKQQVEFRVFDQPQLTEGFTAQQCKVGCCGRHAIMQTEYRRDKDQCVVFQYPRDLPVSFGAAPVEQTQVGQKAISIVQGKACWAASWQMNGTGITIVGPRDHGELVRMVAKVEQALERKTQ